MRNLLAQGGDPLPIEVNLHPTNTPQFNIGQLVSWAIQVLLIGAGIIFFFMLVIGGIRWIMSGGDKAQTENARNQITAALIGLVIVFSAWAVAMLLGSVFGINILKANIPAVPTSETGGGVKK